MTISFVVHVVAVKVGPDWHDIGGRRVLPSDRVYVMTPFKSDPKRCNAIIQYSEGALICTIAVRETFDEIASMMSAQTQGMPPGWHDQRDE